MQVTCAGSTERSARVAARVSRRPAWCGGPRTTSTTSNASVVSSAPGSLTQVGQLYSYGFRLRLAGSGSDPQENPDPVRPSKIHFLSIIVVQS